MLNLQTCLEMPLGCMTPLVQVTALSENSCHHVNLEQVSEIP